MAEELPFWAARVDRQAAKDARSRMDNRDLGDQERRNAAQELLRQILGGPLTDRTIGPIGASWYENLTRTGRDRAVVPDFTPPRRNEDVPPEIEAAFDLMARDYPLAAAKITFLGEYPDKPRAEDPGNTLGMYRRGWGSTFLRTKDQGKPIAFRDIIGTLKHELSHAMGASDDFSTDPKSPISSYDVTFADDRLHSDVNLPIEGAPNSAKLRALRMAIKPLEKQKK